MAMNFDSASAKVARALEHLQSLDDEMQRVFDSNAYGIGGHYKPETAEIDLYALPAEFPIVEWGVRFGDCLHNLRSALDHVAWQLALDHLKRQPTENEARRIQFPIEDTCERFKQAKIRKFVSTTSIGMFDKFQPYHAGNLAATHSLAVLRDLSNVDKHRVVHAAAIVPEEFRFEFAPNSGVISHGEIEVFYGQPLEQHTKIGRIPDVVVSDPKPRMDANGPFTVSIVLDDPANPILHGEHVTQVLGKIGGAVDDTVKWFTRELTP